MRKFLIAIVALLACSSVAWAIVDTSVTITNEGQPVPGAHISLTTTEGPPPTVLKRSDSSGHAPLRYNEKTVKRTARVHVTVRAHITNREGRRQEVTREVDVSMDALISGLLVIDVGQPSAPPPSAPPTAGPPSDFPGTYVGGGAGGRSTQCPDFMNVSTTVLNAAAELSGNPRGCASSGFRGSVMLGSNWLVAPVWVFGVEGDVGLADTSGTIRGIPGLVVSSAFRGNDSINMKETWDAGVRGRLGYLVTPSIMVFGTLGVAFQHVQVTLNCATNGACGFNGIPAFSSSASTTMVGPSVGGGVEVKLGGNWSARGEYRFADYGTWRPTLGTPATLAVASAINMQTHTALFGLSYTFAVPR